MHAISKDEHLDDRTGTRAALLALIAGLANGAALIRVIEAAMAAQQWN